MNENLRFLTLPQFCERVQISKATIYQMLKEGKIKGIRLSEGPRGGWRIPFTELQRMHAMAYQNLKEDKKNE